MSFTGIDFLIKFLPAFLAVYYVLPKDKRNCWLLVGSLVFYSWHQTKTPLYIVLFVISIVFNWLIGGWTAYAQKHKKAVFISGLVFNAGWLIFFKYTYFLHILPFKLVLPLGISFYTFTMISYLADVYTGKIIPERNLLDFGTYAALFPKFVSGPITRYSDTVKRLKNRELKLLEVLDGLMTFIFGMGFKLLIADQLAGLWKDIDTAGFESISIQMAWIGLIGYSLQLYFDFYGYSLMAKGLGRMLGFRLPDNFDAPYTSVTMTEFWRRWHMTLGSWFRDYIYIPLGGNRKGRGRQFINLLCVWLLTGIWHGADWNFVLWGLILFVFIALEKLFLLKFFEEHRIAGHIYMALLIPLSWMVFAIPDMGRLGVYAGRLIGLGGVSVYGKDWIEALRIYWKYLISGIIFCGNFQRGLYRKYKWCLPVWIAAAAVFAASVYCIYKGQNDPFMYFRF